MQALESTQRRLTVVLFISQSFFNAASITAFTVLGIVAVKLGGSNAWAGIPATANLLGHAAAGYPFGWIMDRFGRRVGLSIGLAIGATGTAVSAISIANGSILGVCLGSLLFGIGRSANEQTKYAAAEIRLPHQRARAIGIIVFAGTFGSIFGPLLVAPSGNVAMAYGLSEYVGPFVIAATLIYSAFLINFLFLRPDPQAIGRAIHLQPDAVDTSQTAEAAASTDARSIYEVFASGSVRLAVAAVALSQLVMTTLMVITSVNLEQAQHTTFTISIVYMSHNMGMFGLSAVTGWLVDRFKHTRMIISGALVLIVSALLAPLSTTVPVQIAALFLLGLGWNFCAVAGASLLSNSLRQAERGRMQGMAETFVALSSGTGSVTTGWFFDVGGMRLVGGVGTLISLALALAALWTMRRPRRKPDPVADQVGEASLLRGE